MNTREIAAEYRLTHWAGIMRERQESGLSVKAFCEQSGLHENVYYYWQAKLREAACKALLPDTQIETSKSAVPSGWTMVSEVPKVCETPKAELKSETIYIEIGKSRVIAPYNVDTEHLAKVCKVMFTLC